VDLLAEGGGGMSCGCLCGCDKAREVWDMGGILTFGEGGGCFPGGGGSPA